MLPGKIELRLDLLDSVVLGHTSDPDDLDRGNSKTPVMNKSESHQHKMDEIPPLQIESMFKRSVFHVYIPMLVGNGSS